MTETEQKAKIKHLQERFVITKFELIINCEPHELQLYQYLKLYAIYKHSAFPSRETIKQDLKWEEDKIKYWVKRMEEKGRLKYTPGSGRKSSLYDITWYDKVNLRGGKIQGAEKSTLRGGKNPPSEGGKIPPVTIRNRTKNILSAGADDKKLHLNITALFDYYKQEFKNKISGISPIFNWGICEKNAKSMMRQLGLKKMKDLVDRYFASDDKLYKENAYSLSCFLSAKTLHKLRCLKQ